jgi:hypothetical protein
MWRYVKYVVLCLVVLGVLLGGVFLLSPPPHALAQLGFGSLPFGGRVLAPLPGVTCPDGVEVFTIVPAGLGALPGPYYISATTKRYQYFSALPGRWILGLYNPIPTPCTVGVIIPVIVPAFRITVFGTSPF